MWTTPRWLLPTSGFFAAFAAAAALNAPVTTDGRGIPGWDAVRSGLVPGAAVLVLILIALEYDPGRPTGDGLDRLIMWKRLRHATRPQRLAWDARTPPAPPFDPGPAPGEPADTLDRLLRRKRRGSVADSGLWPG